MKSRKLLAIVGVVVLLFVASVAYAAERNYFIPMISKGFQHQFWQAVKSGAEKAAQDYGVTITFEGPESEAMVDKQIDMLQAALAKKPNALCLAALDAKAVIPYVEKAKEMGIPVICFDSGVESDIPVTTVATDNLKAAAYAADKMAELIGGEGEVALVVHDQTSRTGIERRDGFVNRIKEAYPKNQNCGYSVRWRRPLEVYGPCKSHHSSSPQPQRHFRSQRRIGYWCDQRRQGTRKSWTDCRHWL